VPYDKRIQAARFIEDLTAGYQGGWYSLISLHGGGSPAAMKQEIWRHYPVGSKVDWWSDCWSAACCTICNGRSRRTASKCCDMGCSAPGQPVMGDLPKPRT
jgi:4-hydroxybutyryl-CoA dehydratase / vinylacetyl-CoA-Delta-isomerase